MKVIDSHVHIWDPAHLDYKWLGSNAALNRPFLPRHLPYSPTNTAAAVFVQADCGADQALKEVDWVSGFGGDWSELAAIVAFAPVVDGARVEADLEQLAQRPLVKGVRQLFQDLDESTILASRTIEGARRVARAGFTFDACVRYWQLDALTKFAARVPELRIVLDHFGKPPIAEGGLERWSRSIRDLAKLPNVLVKLSGGGAEAAPDQPLAPQVIPFLTRTIDAFGPERCMIGSDWPVSMKTPSAYQEWIDVVLNSVLANATSAERENVASATAARFYRLGASSHERNIE